MADLECIECGENLGKSSEQNLLVHCGRCGSKTPNEDGIDKNLKIPNEDKTDKLNKNNHKLKSKKMAEEKAKAKSKTRTDENLAKGSLKEKIYLFMRKGYNAENKNYIKEGKKPEMAFKGVERLYVSKLPSAVFNRAGKEGEKGSEFWKLSDSNEKIVALKNAVNSAKEDLIAKKWTPSVQKAMNLFLDIKGTRAVSGTNTDVLKKIVL